MSTLLPVHPVSGVRAVGIVGGRPVYPILGADTRGDEATTTRLAEIDERRDALRTEIVAFDGRDLDDTESESLRTLVTEWDTLETERGPLAERAANIERVRSATVTRRGLEHVGDGPHVKRTVDPFEDLERVRNGQLDAADLRSRALAAIEQVTDEYVRDDQKERAEQLVRRDKRGRISRHMLLTGSEAYLNAFEEVLSGTKEWNLRSEQAAAMELAGEHLRAMNEGTNASGGFLVPFFLDPTIMLTNAGSTNPFRQLCTVKTITGKQWAGVTSAGVTAEWTDEATEAADASPNDFAQPNITAHKADAYLQASFEVTQDTSIASEIGMLLTDAKDNLEATAFAVGNGTLKPKGVVTAVAAVAGSVVTSATAATYAVADVYSVAGAVPPRFRGNAAWVAEYNTWLKTRQFASGTGPQHAFWADLGMATPPLLLGKPVHESSAMDNTLAASTVPIMVGDFARGYVIVDRIGMTVQYEPLVKGANRRPTGEVGWYAHWRVGGDVVNVNALRALKIHA